jgi:hypothetical protein
MRRYDAFKNIVFDESAPVDIFMFLFLVQCYSYINYLILFPTHEHNTCSTFVNNIINIMADIYVKQKKVHPYVDCISNILGFDIRKINHPHIPVLHSLIGVPANPPPSLEFSTSTPYRGYKGPAENAPPEVIIKGGIIYNDVCSSRIIYNIYL